MSITDRLEQIEERASRATEGPWYRHDYGGPGDQEPSSIVVHRGKFDWDSVREGEFVVSTPQWDRQETDDADFIAAARVDVPELVDAVRQREAAIQAVLNLHQETWHDGPICTYCVQIEGDDIEPAGYPCPTVKALTAESPIPTVDPEWGTECASGVLRDHAHGLAETVAWLYGREPDDEDGRVWLTESWQVDLSPGGRVRLTHRDEEMDDLAAWAYHAEPDEAMDLARALIQASEEARNGQQ